MTNMRYDDDIRGDGVGVGAWNQIWDDSVHWTMALTVPTLGFSSVSTLHIIPLFRPGAHFIAFIQISIQLKATSFSLTWLPKKPGQGSVFGQVTQTNVTKAPSSVSHWTESQKHNHVFVYKCHVNLIHNWQACKYVWALKNKICTILPHLGKKSIFVTI